MPSFFRFLLFLMAGLVLGSLANMGVVLLGSKLVPLPKGVNPSDAASIAKHLHLFSPVHFLPPFLAHAMGTFVAALFVEWRLKTSYWRGAFVPGLFFLLGGIAAAAMIPAPAWFVVLDLGAAYLPTSWLAWRCLQSRSET